MLSWVFVEEVSEIFKFLSLIKLHQFLGHNIGQKQLGMVESGFGMQPVKPTFNQNCLQRNWIYFDWCGLVSGQKPEFSIKMWSLELIELELRKPLGLGPKSPNPLNQNQLSDACSSRNWTAPSPKLAKKKILSWFYLLHSNWCLLSFIVIWVYWIWIWSSLMHSRLPI